MRLATAEQFLSPISIHFVAMHSWNLHVPLSQIAKKNT